MSGIVQPRKATLERLLNKALADEGFRNLLISSPSAVAHDEVLSSQEVGILQRLSRDEFEEIGVDVRPFRQLLKTDAHKC